MGNAEHTARIEAEIAALEATVVPFAGGDFLDFLLNAPEGEAETFERIDALKGELKIIVAAERASRVYTPKHEPCGRCGGKGKINCYTHVSRGICFGCNGAGRVFLAT